MNALVTGGSRGIGRAISIALARQGAQAVVVNYLENDAEAQATKQQVEENNSRCILAKANLLFPQEVDRLFETVRSEIGHLGALVHCAAIGAFKPLMQVKPNQWDLSVNINARGFLLCVQKAVPLMKSGSIVAISSLGSRRYVRNYGAMGATKAALESLIRYLAVDLGPRGIRVNGVAGGFVTTSSIPKFPDADDMLEEARLRTPCGRLGTPEDIAGVAMFLISPAAGWICGQTIVADGGLSLL